MSKKRSHDEITPSVPRDGGVDHKEIVQALKKMIRRIEENKEDINTILDVSGSGLNFDNSLTQQQQREVITETDVDHMLNHIKTLIGDRVHEGEVLIHDDDPDVRVFEMKIVFPLSISDKDLNLISKLPDVAKVVLDQTELCELTLSVTYTKSRKLTLLYKQQEETDEALSSKKSSNKKPNNNVPLDGNNLSAELLNLLESSFDVDLDDESDVQVQTKSSKNQITDVIFSLSARGPIRYEQIASVAAHRMINYLRLYPGVNKNLLRLELATFKVG